MSEPLEHEDPGTELDRLRAECARLAEALVVPDDDGYRHVDRHEAIGETARVWQDVQWRINELAAQLAAATQLLDRAALVRQRQPADRVELTRMLRGPCEVVLISATGAPAEVVRQPLPEVIAAAGENHSAVLAVTTAVDAARRAAVDRLASLAERLANLDGPAGAVRMPTAVLTELRAELDLLRAGADRDPLGAAEGASWQAQRDRLDGRITEVAARIGRAEQLRHQLPDAVDELRMLIGRLDAHETEARLAWRGLAAVPGEAAVGAPEPRAGTLRARLRRLEQRCRQDEWWDAAGEPEAAPQLGAEVASATVLAERTRDTAVAHRRRLAEFRVELRGRLEAFRHKAISLGRSEDLMLTDLYDEARRLLRADPLDASAADQAVWRYQSAVNEEAQP
ncbi:hypothetical protein ACWDV4_13880 [Micromonospora sp. NPDC003197]